MRSWLIAVAALGLALALGPLARRGLRHANASPALPLARVAENPGVRPVERGVSDAGVSDSPPPSAALAGLDLVHIAIGDDGATALTAAHQVAHLTIDVGLERTATALLRERHLPEAAIVMIDPETGRVLVYASHVERGEARDLCARASAPAASVFKVVTASALIDDAGLEPDTRQCYAGGDHRILPGDLVEDPARDRWCTTLSGAMGRSINTVFARLALKNLTPERLSRKAKSFGYDEPLPFDVPVEPSALRVPTDTLGFARTAAGFWNTTLSPLHAAWMSAALAHGGEAMRPFIVQDVVGSNGTQTYSAPAASPARRMVAPATAQALVGMMERTVSEGTSYRAFHDAAGTPFLPGLIVAGKTGTLSDDHAHRLYTWFAGLAPSRPVAGVRPVAIAAYVANDPMWRIKANVLAREMLRAYFAEQKIAGVTRPVPGRIPSGE